MASAYPARVLTASGEQWTGLEILETTAGGQGDEVGEVEFRAHITGTDEVGRCMSCPTSP